MNDINENYVSRLEDSSIKYITLFGILREHFEDLPVNVQKEVKKKSICIKTILTSLKTKKILQKINKIN